MTTIYALADIHGQLPDWRDCPECDLLLIGGDICPDMLPEDQFRWLNQVFRTWLERVPARNIVGIAGNHDLTFEQHEAIENLKLPWHYLRNESVSLEGLTIYGIPFIPTLAGWAFYAEDHVLAEMYEEIPMDTDIILSHGPPFGYGDTTCSRYGGIPAGSIAGLEAIQRIQPKAFICGHIHEGRGLYRPHVHNGDGVYQVSQTEIYNVSMVDQHYRAHSDPFIEVTL